MKCLNKYYVLSNNSQLMKKLTCNTLYAICIHFIFTFLNHILQFATLQEFPQWSIHGGPVKHKTNREKIRANIAVCCIRPCLHFSVIVQLKNRVGGGVTQSPLNVLYRVPTGNFPL